jgi:hypothetical protein
VVWCFSQSTECYKQWVSNIFWSRSILRSCKFFVTSFMESKKIYCKRLVFFFFSKFYLYTAIKTLYTSLFLFFIFDMGRKKFIRTTL